MTTLMLQGERGTGHDDHAGDSKERRRGMRVREQRPVKVYEMASTRFFGGQTQDISGTGLRVELPAWVPVRPGGLLLVHVGQNRGGAALANRKSMIPTRVVWMKRETDLRGAVVTAGLEFSVAIEARLDAA